MLEIPSYLIAKKMVLEDMNEKLEPGMRTIAGKEDALRRLCEAMDMQMKHDDGEFFNFEVDPDTLTLHMTYGLVSICAKGSAERELLEALSAADSISIRTGDDGMVIVECIIERFWSND